MQWCCCVVLCIQCCVSVGWAYQRASTAILSGEILVSRFPCWFVDSLTLQVLILLIHLLLNCTSSWDRCKLSMSSLTQSSTRSSSFVSNSFSVPTSYSAWAGQYRLYMQQSKPSQGHPTCKKNASVIQDWIYCTRIWCGLDVTSYLVS